MIMKNKFMKTRNVFAVLLVSALLLALAACGNDSQPSGKYLLAGVTGDPDGTTFAELDEMYKAKDERITDYWYMEFLSGGRFTLVLSGETEAGGTYTRDGNVLTLTAAGKSSDAVINGKKITYTYETGAKLIFRKAPEGLSKAALIWIITGSVALVLIAGIAVLAVKKRKKA